MRRFSDLLTTRMRELDMSPLDLARMLRDQRGIQTSRQAITAWKTGGYRPESWKWSALLDVLAITEPERSEWRTALEAVVPGSSRRGAEEQEASEPAA